MASSSDQRIELENQVFMMLDAGDTIEELHEWLDQWYEERQEEAE